MNRKALTPRQHVLLNDLPTKSSYGLLGKLSGRSGDKLLDDIKEYFFVCSFKLMRSSNIEETKRKRKVPFRKLPFCKVHKALVCFISLFFRKL